MRLSTSVNARVATRSRYETLGKKGMAIYLCTDKQQEPGVGGGGGRAEKRVSETTGTHLTPIIKHSVIWGGLKTRTKDQG